MPLSAKKAVDQARLLYDIHEAERGQLDIIRRYWKGRQALPAVIPTSAPSEVRVMASSSRVNVMPIVVNTLVQSTFVDAFRSQGQADDLDVWAIWQANRMDARQTAIHRAAYAYGAAYAVVLPGDPAPVIRGVSPRSLTAVYGEDQDWPMWALERRGGNLWRLYDDEASYFLSSDGFGTFEFVETREHGLGVTPVVRYLNEDDLDADDEVDAEAPRGRNREENLPTRGEVAALIPLQDQIDLTTFSLQIAQHYGAFRQRYLIGWAAEDEKQVAKTAASQLWTFDQNPDELKAGEFSQTDLDGYIKSREASLRHAATLSQTPVHELIGELVNLSAEALAAAEKGHDRKLDERKTVLGESHEQTLWLAGQANATVLDVPDDAQVSWRDTSARAFAATIDGLGKMATMLGIPPQAIWERVPGATQQDVERWKTMAAEGNAFTQLEGLLKAQGGAGSNGNGNVPAGLGAGA